MAVAPVAFRGYIDDEGHFSLSDKHAFRQWARALAGREVAVTIKPISKGRSLDQNAYWWAEPVKRLAEHCGYTDSQMHYALLGECFGYTAGPAGHAIPVKPSSSDLSVEEFSRLIDWVLTWAPSELGVQLMAPNEWQATETVA